MLLMEAPLVSVLSAWHPGNQGVITSNLVSAGVRGARSPHVTTGLWGLGLLSLQAMLPLLFADEPGLRGVHSKAVQTHAMLMCFCGTAHSRQCMPWFVNAHMQLRPCSASSNA